MRRWVKLLFTDVREIEEIPTWFRVVALVVFFVGLFGIPYALSEIWY